MMMARGRGGAIGGGGVIALVLLVGLFVATSAPPVAEAAASYMVGDYGGWKFNVDRWAKGRTFRAGDVLGTYIYISTSCCSSSSARIFSACAPPLRVRRHCVRAVFSYNRAVHDVAVVNAAAYRSCAVPNKGARVLRSGRDKVRLGRGTHYFACTVRGHCQAGMKLAVRAV
jgi:hypothetical protein